MKTSPQIATVVKLATTATLTAALSLITSTAHAASFFFGNLSPYGHTASQDLSSTYPAFQLNQVSQTDNQAVTFFTPNDGVTRKLAKIVFYVDDSNTQSETIDFHLYSGITLNGGTGKADSIPTSATPVFSQSITTPSGTQTDQQPSVITNGTLTIDKYFLTVDFSGLNFILNPNSGYGLQLDASSSFSGWYWGSNGTNTSYQGAAAAVNTLSLWSTNTGTGGAGNYQVSSWTGQTAHRLFDVYIESVPFEFSPTWGLLAIGGLWGANQLRKKSAVKKQITL